MIRDLRGFTVLCRFLCSVLVAAPLIYSKFVEHGDAYHFIVLVLLAPLAGIVLFANTVFVLLRDRKRESPWIGLAFLLVGVIGVAVAWHFLPQFRM